MPKLNLISAHILLMSIWCGQYKHHNHSSHVCDICCFCLKCHCCEKQNKCSGGLQNRHCCNKKKNVTKLFVDKMEIRRFEDSPTCSPHKHSHHNDHDYCRTLNPTRSHAQITYYDANVSQTISNGLNVKFNTNSFKSPDIVHNEITNNDTIIFLNIGVYKIEYMLTLEPNIDVTTVDEHIFAAYLNNVLCVNSKFGAGQSGNVTPYQLNGSFLLNVSSCNSTLTLKNIGSIPVTLARSIDSNSCVGANIVILRIS